MTSNTCPAFLVREIQGLAALEQFLVFFFSCSRIEPGHPNPRACLLYQKLQLINYCIAKRLEREKRALRPSDDSDSDPDEFYDCFENENEDSEKAKRASWDQPTGRQSKHGNQNTVLEPVFPSNLPNYIRIT